MDRLVLALVGLPYAGKGECAAPVLESHGFTIFGTRQELEKHASPEVLEKMCHGDVAPDEVMIRLLRERVPSTDRIAFDSLRSVPQAEWMVNHYATHCIVTCHVKIRPETSLARLKKGASAKRGKRNDDKAISTRLAKAEVYLPPLVDYLKENTHYFEVDGEQAPELVKRDIERELRLYVAQAFGRMALSAGC